MAQDAGSGVSLSAEHRAKLDDIKVALATHLEQAAHIIAHALGHDASGPRLLKAIKISLAFSDPPPAGTAMLQVGPDFIIVSDDDGVGGYSCGVYEDPPGICRPC